MADLMPLNLEIIAALAILREKGYLRAANRLERMSQHILKPGNKKPKAKSVKVKLIGRNGRSVSVRISQDLMDQAEAKQP